MQFEEAVSTLEYNLAKFQTKISEAKLTIRHEELSLTRSTAVYGILLLNHAVAGEIDVVVDVNLKQSASTPNWFVAKYAVQALQSYQNRTESNGETPRVFFDLTEADILSHLIVGVVNRFRESLAVAYRI